MEYRELKKSEISKELFASFVRRQEVNAVLTRIDGQWREISRPFIDDWSPSDYDFLVKCLINTIETGGAVFGAFDEKGRLKAFASLEGGIFGRKHRYKDLSSLHVSAECRRSGIGKKLFCMAALKAKANGADRLYISAHSAVETQSFYLSMGCRDAEEINALHSENEPCDRQMECDLSRFG